MESSENIKFLTNTQNESATLVLTNSVSILDSEHLRDVILEAFENFQSFDINIEALHSIDLSGIQLLYSVFQTAKNLKKNVSITGNLPEDLKKDIENAGFSQLNWLYGIE